MKEGPDIARIAALIGDPARANMLSALMSGKALTASELAEEAGVTIQTASSHLAKLHEGGLLRPRKQGRHKYFALANDQVAEVIEGLMGLSARSGHLRSRTGPRDAALRRARVCYNHLAGEMGIRLLGSMLGRKLLFDREGMLELSDDGREFASGLGIDLSILARSRSPLCLECLDWSERRSHLAGSLGRAILSRFEASEWVHIDRGTRIVTFSPAGQRAFDRLFP